MGLVLPMCSPVRSPIASPLAGGGGPAWQPSDLYTGSDDGTFLDFTTIGNLFQADQTTPVSASGQLIGKIADMSGKGNHFLAVAGGEPQYTVTTGFGYCYFGAGKWLEKLLAKPASFTIVTAMRSGIGHVVASGGSGGASATMWGQLSVTVDGRYSWSFGDGSNYSAGSSDAPVAVSGVNAIVAQVYTSGDTKPTIYSDALAPVAVTHTAGTATSLGGTTYKYCLGRLGEFASAWTGRLYGHCVINRVLTAPELAAVYGYFRAKMPM